MACYISAGHHLKDPGAISRGLKEADLTMEVRDAVVALLRTDNYRVIVDDDKETLSEYLKRIQPGTGSVVVEFHFDAAESSSAIGTSAFHADGASRASVEMAEDFAEATARILGIKNRGALPEGKSGRGKLGLLREAGTVALIEVCFISNPVDIEKYQAHKEELFKEYARIIGKYDDMFI